MLAQNDEAHVVNTTSSNGGSTPLINSAWSHATTKAAVTTITECLWGQLPGKSGPRSAHRCSTRRPSHRECSTPASGGQRQSAEWDDRPGAPPKEGRLRLGAYLSRMEAAGMEVQFAPLSEVADVAFEGIVNHIFWITVPHSPQQIRSESARLHRLK